MGEQFWCVFENGSQTGLKNVTHNTLLTIPTRDQVVFSGYAGGGYALCNTGSSLVLYYMHPSAETIHTGSPDTPYALCANPSATSYRDAWAYLARDKGKSTWSIYTHERHISLPEGLVPYSRTHFAYLSGSLILSLQQPGDANSGSGGSASGSGASGAASGSGGSASGSGASGAASGSGAVSGAGSPVLYYKDQFTRYRFNGYIDGWSYGE